MENKYYPHLFQKGTVGGVVLKNRIVRNSMGTYLGNPDGTVTDRQIKAYAQAADGGAGLIFMDNAVPVPMDLLFIWMIFLPRYRVETESIYTVIMV